MIFSNFSVAHMWIYKLLCSRSKCPSLTPPNQTKQPVSKCQTSTFPRSNFYKMSTHCHDEHEHSGHGHSHADHDHTDDITPALQYSLYQHINFDDIITLNESETDSGRAIIKKTWTERLEVEPELESDADEQLLIHIPCVYIIQRG
jgi:hypothetical protein